MNCFFHDINKNILFHCTANKLLHAISLSFAQKDRSHLKITVRLEHAAHISKLQQTPTLFRSPTLANAMPIELQAIFRLKIDHV